MISFPGRVIFWTYSIDGKVWNIQARPQDLLLDDFHNGDSFGEELVKAGSLGSKSPKILETFYHVTFWDQKKIAAKFEFEIWLRTRKLYARGSGGFLER